jgi:hypothetical protein
MLTKVGKIFEENQCGSGSDTQLFLANLLICELRTGHTKEICGLIITNLRIFNLRTGTPKKLTDSRLWNKPKKLWIAICGLTKKFACPPLSKQYLYRSQSNSLVYYVSMFLRSCVISRGSQCTLVL